MKTYHIIHFGIGNVGKTFVEQLFTNREKFKKEFGVDLNYCAMFGSKGGFFKKTGISESEFNDYYSHLSQPQITSPLTFLKNLEPEFLTNTIFIDTTTSSILFPILSFVLKSGASAVLSNKLPLAASFENFKTLQKFGGKRFFYETTVGAGLPVIKTLKEMIATGDENIRISGCFSGTLGFICSALEKGIPFSQSVALAKEKGITEPDPREDLSGMDVARKAIILARVLGKEIEMKDLSVEALYPASYSNYSVSEFMEHIHELDEKYAKMFRKAAKKHNTYRYVASISDKKCSVGLQEGPKHSQLGSLNGPDNMIVFATKRYSENPLVIQGPGAGLEVTAAGVFGDIVSIIA